MILIIMSLSILSHTIMKFSIVIVIIMTLSIIET
jgi:hypothetical protein